MCVSSTAASEVPQAAGGDPTAEGARPPEGRARQTAGAGDKEHQKLPGSELWLLTLRLVESPLTSSRGNTCITVQTPPFSNRYTRLRVSSYPFNKPGEFTAQGWLLNLNFTFAFTLVVLVCPTQRCTLRFSSCTYTQTLSPAHLWHVFKTLCTCRTSPPFFFLYAFAAMQFHCNF